MQNPCAAITCASGAVSPAPALASVADANADICCVSMANIALSTVRQQYRHSCVTYTVPLIIDRLTEVAPALP